MGYSLILYLSAGFLVLYGLRSFVAGVRNEKKSYWINITYDTGLRKLLKEKYDKVNNLVWGGVSFIAGLLIIILY